MLAVAAELPAVEIGGKPAKVRCVDALGRGQGEEGGVEVGACRHGYTQGRVRIVDPPAPPRLCQRDHVVVPDHGFGDRRGGLLPPDRDGALGVGDKDNVGRGEVSQRSPATMPDILFAVEGPIVSG